MSGKERLIAVLKGEVPDRIPVSPFVQEEYLSYHYPEEAQVYRVEHAVRLAKELGFDVMTRDLTYTVPYFLRNSYTNWKVSHSEEISGSNMYRRTLIETPEGNLEQVEVAPYDSKTIAGIHFSTSKYFFESREEWDLFKKYVPEIDSNEIEGMKAKAKRDNDIIGNLGIACPWGWGGVYNMASTYRSIESLMIDPYLDPDFYKDYMTTLSDMIALNYSHLADTEFVCMGIQGNIANAAMLSADFFDEFVAPYEKKAIDAVHEKGKYVLYHNCGCAKAFYESYVKLGVDIWETVAPAPQGDNSLEEAAEIIDGRMILMGNLDQVDFLKRATADKVVGATKDIMAAGMKNRRFIFACSDFLEKDTPLENIKVMIETAREAGRLLVESEAN